MPNTNNRRAIPIPLPSGWGILGALVATFVLPTGAALMNALTAAFVEHYWLRSLLLGLAGVGLLTVVLSLHAGVASFWERWRFRCLRSAVGTLRKAIQGGGEPGGAAQDALADLAGPLFQLGVFQREPLPSLRNIVHLRTALAALDNCMRRWALREARSTKWKTDYAPNEDT